MPKYYITEGLSVVMGAQFDFHLGYKYDGEKVDLSKDNTKNTNISLGIGAGYDVGPIALSARYFWGVKNMYDGDVDDVKFKINTFQLSAGLKF